MGSSFFSLILDTTAPTMSQLKVKQITRYFSMVTCICNEPSKIVLHLGKDPNNLDKELISEDYFINPMVNLSFLEPDTRYYFILEVIDEVWNKYYEIGMYSFKTLTLEEMPSDDGFEDTEFELKVELVADIEKEILNNEIIETQINTTKYFDIKQI